MMLGEPFALEKNYEDSPVIISCNNITNSGCAILKSAAKEAIKNLNNFTKNFSSNIPQFVFLEEEPSQLAGGVKIISHDFSNSEIEGTENVYGIALQSLSLQGRFANIVINKDHLPQSVGGVFSGYLQTVETIKHQLLHILGVGHSQNKESLMYPEIKGGAKMLDNDTGIILNNIYDNSSLILQSSSCDDFSKEAVSEWIEFLDEIPSVAQWNMDEYLVYLFNFEYRTAAPLPDDITPKVTTGYCVVLPDGSSSCDK